MASKNLRSVVGQANRVVRSKSRGSHRSFRSSSRSNNESPMAWVVNRSLGLPLGCYLANLLYGDRVWKLDDERIEVYNELRIPGTDLRKDLWCYQIEKVFCDTRDKLWSGLKEKFR